MWTLTDTRSSAATNRLQVLKEMGVKQVPCVVLDLDDAEARLLAQALNHVEGVDNAGLKAELVKEVLKSIPRSRSVGSPAREPRDGLSVLESLGEADLAGAPAGMGAGPGRAASPFHGRSCRRASSR